MYQLVRLFVVVIASAFLLPAQQWTDVRPRLKWENRMLKPAEAKQLLAQICSGKVEEATLAVGNGFRCVLPRRGDCMLKEGVFETAIYGHFLSPTSEDVAVSGSVCETHPDLWGGTLLLTKRGGNWHRVWYRSRLITRFCQKVTLPTGRDILLCENNDRGTGQHVHWLYAVDFTNSRGSFQFALITAQSVVALPGAQKEVTTINRIDFSSLNAGRPVFMSVSVQHQRMSLPKEQRFPGYRAPTKEENRIDFLLTENGLETAPWSAHAARHFSGW